MRIQLQDRVEILQRFIDIAAISLDLKSFCVAQAILVGLCSNVVLRMKRTFAALPSDSWATFAELDTKLSLEDDFACYRSLLKKCEGHPSVPMMACHLRDLAVLSEQPLYMDAERKIVSMARMLQISEVVGEIKRTGEKPYPFHFNRHLQEWFQYGLEELSESDKLIWCRRYAIL